MRNYTVNTVNEVHSLQQIIHIDRSQGMMYFYKNNEGRSPLPELILPEQEIISVVAHQVPSFQNHRHMEQPF